MKAAAQQFLFWDFCRATFWRDFFEIPEPGGEDGILAKVGVDPKIY